MQGKYITSK